MKTHAKETGTPGANICRNTLEKHDTTHTDGAPEGDQAAADYVDRAHAHALPAPRDRAPHPVHAPRQRIRELWVHRGSGVCGNGFCVSLQ